MSNLNSSVLGPVASVSDALPGSAVGFTNLLRPTNSPLPGMGQNAGNRTVVTADDENNSPATPRTVDAVSPTNGKQDKETDNTFLFLSMLIANKANDDGDVSASDSVSMLNMLEAAGFNVNPIRNIISDVTGRPYSDFAASASTGGHISAEDLLSGYNHGRGYGARGRDPQIGSLIQDGRIDAQRGIMRARTDGIGEGWCARGTRSVLTAMGFTNLPHGNATNWDEQLTGNSQWRRVETDLSHIREGSLIIVQNNEQSGRGASNNRHGAQFGHISVALRDPHNPNGMVFVSDEVRNSIWGSVRGNKVVVFEPVLPGGSPAPTMANNARHHSPAPAPV